jgi:hypothetical protein
VLAVTLYTALLAGSWPHNDAHRRRPLRTTEQHLRRSAAKYAGGGYARVDLYGSEGWGFESPERASPVRHAQRFLPDYKHAKVDDGGYGTAE